MLADLGNPSAETIAASLGVHVRTVYRWKRTDQAPKAVMLAVFWATRWGRSAIDCATTNEAAMHAGLADCLKRENEALRRELARVVSVGDFGSANAPTMREARLRVASVAPGLSDPFEHARQTAREELHEDARSDQQQG